MTDNRINTQQAVVIDPVNQPADAVVIWLHGLGADGHDFEPLVPELGLPQNHAVRFIFPHAPIDAVTLNGGMPMRSWYDIRSLDLVDEVDFAGIEHASVSIAALVDQQMNLGIDSTRIILAGFSQGGLVALYCGLHYPYPLAGVMALSTYLPEPCLSVKSQNNNHFPVLMMHGQLDNMVPFSLGKASKSLLQAQGYAVEWYEYPMEHQICGVQIKQIAQWLKDRLC